jgi:hypothetical protein
MIGPGAPGGCVCIWGDGYGFGIGLDWGLYFLSYFKYMGLPMKNQGGLSNRYICFAYQRISDHWICDHSRHE